MWPIRTVLAVLAVALPISSCQEYPEVTLTPGQQKKVQAHLLKAEPSPKHRLGAIIEDQVELLGYDIDRTTVTAGEQVTLTYYIKALVDPRESNSMFVHLQGGASDRAAWMNLDHNPIDGLLPLRDLKKGQIVKDVQKIKIKDDFTPGKATIYWGLFRGDYRLKITNAAKVKHDGKNRVKVATLTILPGKGSKAPTAQKGVPVARAIRLVEGEQIEVDGKADEAAWQKAPWTRYWGLPNGKSTPTDNPAPRARARFVWNEQNLYIAVECEDADVWSTFTQRDSNTWEQEVIEVFIDADGDRKDYIELQVTPANVVFDARFEKHRSDLAKARAWTLEGWKTAVSVDGTLNQRDDADKGYVVEMAIPVAKVPGASAPLKHRDAWRLNLFRWDFPKGKKQVAAAFSPPIVPDFHALDRFGKLRFLDNQRLDTKIIPVRPTGQPERIRLDPKKIRPATKLNLGKAIQAPPTVPADISKKHPN